jgi:hypothetical protein
VLELSTRKLLVMDYLEGGTLRDALVSRLRACEAAPWPLRLPALYRLRHEAKRHLALLLDAQARRLT